jgi:hypothetical protein
MPLLRNLEPTFRSCAYSHTWMRELIFGGVSRSRAGPQRRSWSPTELRAEEDLSAGAADA